jgi:archaellum biogenesis ATPase FlaH
LTHPRITIDEPNEITPRPRLPVEHVNGTMHHSIPGHPLERGGTESNPPPTAHADDAPYRLVPLGDLGPSEQPDWLLPGYIARGAITLLTGLWKSGKSTMLAHLLRDLHRGGGLVEVPTDGTVLIVSEEPPGVWARRRDALGLDADRVLIVQRPSFARTNALEWRRLIEGLREDIAAHDVALVVIDTLPSVWPTVNENDASEVLEAIGPLRDLSEAGAAVLIVMHPRKGGGAEATATRGSGALPGFVDVIVELRRHNAEDSHDRRRLLTAYGRFDGIPPETVIELTDTGYAIIGERAEVRAADEQTIILNLLPADGRGLGLDAEAIRERWPAEPTIGLRRLRGLLIQGVEQHKWKRRGMGVKGDPFTFTLLPAGAGDADADSIPFRDTPRGEPESNPSEDTHNPAQGLAPERTAWHTDATEGGRDQWPV